MTSHPPPPGVPQPNLIPAPGESNLNTLLSTMSPTLDSENIYVFTTFPPNTSIPTTLYTQMLYRESQGTTIITTSKSASDHAVESTFPSRLITLNVHSSLEAVGFLACITTRLAKDLRIGVNPVSGYFHDHLFVPETKAEDVMRVLESMVREAKIEVEAEKFKRMIDGWIGGEVEKGSWKVEKGDSK